MNRTQLQQLAEEREHDAHTLLNGGRWSGAYYLAGYAVECGLKACIARRINQDDFPDKELAVKCYTHKIQVLVKLAELETIRVADMILNPALGKSWQIVKDWDEEARYQPWTELQARKTIASVADIANGVLPWIKLRW